MAEELQSAACALEKAGAAGLLCTKGDPKYGGGGGDLYHCMIIIEEQTRACFNELAFYLHSDIIAPYIELYGTEPQRQRYLPKMATGEYDGRHRHDRAQRRLRPAGNAHPRRSRAAITTC